MSRETVARLAQVQRHGPEPRRRLDVPPLLPAGALHGAFEVAFGAASAAGPNRLENQDACLIDEDLGLCLVADGVGGRPRGAVASIVAVNNVHAAVRDVADLYAAPGQALDLRPFAAATLRLAFELVHLRVMEAARSGIGALGMATTLAAALVVEGGAWVVAVGDSRIYRLEAYGLCLLAGNDCADTVDSVGRTRRCLTRAVGGGPPARAVPEFVPLQAGESLLLCSDGVWDALSPMQLHNLATGQADAGLAAAALVAAARVVSLDDATAVITRCVPAESKRP